MGETTGIAWCHHTFNPWWGCVEVSPGCDDCYARTWALRMGFHLWGHDATRRFFGDKHWNEPVKWNRVAEAAGERRRVFCASMADIGEVRSDTVGRELDEARERLYALILATPWLDWLLLTKRPKFYRDLPAAIRALPRVWPGVSVENAEYTWRLSEMLKVDMAGPPWASYEPAIGPVDWRPFLPGFGYPAGARHALRWLVIGGESRNRREPRPFDVQWVRSGIAVCRAAGTAGAGAGRGEFCPDETGRPKNFHSR